MVEARVEAVENNEWGKRGFKPMTMATATVSPSARAVARVTAPTMPVRAAGSTTLRSTCHFVAPTLSAPSNWSWGTTAMASRDRATIMGRIMMKSTQPASSSDTPSKGGWKGKWWPVRSARLGWTVCSNQGASTSRPQSP